jgi:hypothetical protein
MLPHYCLRFLAIYSNMPAVEERLQVTQIAGECEGFGKKPARSGKIPKGAAPRRPASSSASLPRAHRADTSGASRLHIPDA